MLVVFKSLRRRTDADRDNFNKALDAKLDQSEYHFDDAGIEFTSETAAANIKSRVFIRGNRFQQAHLEGYDQTRKWGRSSIRLRSQLRTKATLACRKGFEALAYSLFPSDPR
jgi:hypothetical protein